MEGIGNSRGGVGLIGQKLKANYVTSRGGGGSCKKKKQLLYLLCVRTWGEGVRGSGSVINTATVALQQALLFYGAQYTTQHQNGRVRLHSLASNYSLVW